MSKNQSYEIISNQELVKNVYEMILKGDVSEIKAPGQFINIKLDGLYLRRPISICDYDEETITIIYKVVGQGTKLMSKLKEHHHLDVLVALGNGFTIKAAKKQVVVGGGVGIPPMYNLAKQLIKQNKTVIAVLGFNTKDEMFYVDKFKALGIDTIITSVDGSVGIKGYVSDALKAIDYDYYYACGPKAMLKAVYDLNKGQGQLSFEERMGCGFGACMGCTCQTLYGNKRICIDGPVLESEEVIWEKA